MTADELLDNYTHEQLLRILRKREPGIPKSGKAAESGFVSSSEDPLPDVPSDKIVRALKSQQKSVYGTDDRLDLCEVEEPVRDVNSPDGGVNDVDEACSAFVVFTQPDRY